MVESIFIHCTLCFKLLVTDFPYKTCDPLYKIALVYTTQQCISCLN